MSAEREALRDLLATALRADRTEFGYSKDRLDHIAAIKRAVTVLAAPPAPAEPSAEARDERAAFEAWAREHQADLLEPDQIGRLCKAMAWNAWRACAAQKGGAA